MLRRSLLVIVPLLASVSAQQPGAPASVPLAQIAVRGEELGRTLRDLARQLPPDEALTEFEERLGQQEETVRARLEESKNSLSESATILELRDEARHWRAYGSPEARQRKTLQAWGNACEQAIAALNKHQAVWQATLQNTQALHELDAVRGPVRQSLKDIEAARSAAEQRLRTVIGLQARVSKQASAVADIIDELDQATRSFQKRLFTPDAPPLWRAWAAGGSRESLRDVFRRSLRRSYDSTADLAGSRQGFLLQALSALALAFAAIYWLGHRVVKDQAADPCTANAARILGRPFSLAVLLAAPVALGVLPVAQLSLGLLLIQVFVVPMVRILPLIVDWGARVIYFFAVFYGLHALVWALHLDPSLGRELTVVLFSAALIVLAWRGELLPVRRASRRNTPRENRIVRWAFAIFALILAANVLGFGLLSNLLRLVTILSSYIALVIYTLARVLNLLISGVSTSPWLSPLATVRLHRANVLKWTTRLVNAGALFWWMYIVLDLLALRVKVFRSILALIDARIGIRAFTISAGDILAFLGVLIVGCLAANAIRFILREEILSRLHLTRGVPEMIATSSYYLLLLLVFLMSLSAVGVQLDKLTVLTGAVGVGVGFGLQNLVNNFVSGLVLQFERPIRLGDILEVGTLGGEVRRIGARSSTVRTFQGAEVIIPNSALVSNQVVNWTLSEAVRRVDLQLTVIHGTPPERVIQLLAAVAAGHSDVLREPEAEAFFMGFSPSGMDFLLMFWAEQTTHFRVRSEVAIRVNAALREAGIEIAVPQQDVRVRSAEPSAAQRLTRIGAA